MVNPVNPLLMSEVNPVNPLQVLVVNPVNPLDRQRLIRSNRFGQSVSLVNPVTTSEVNPVNPLQAGFEICHDICLSFSPATTCNRLQVVAAATG